MIKEKEAWVINNEEERQILKKLLNIEENSSILRRNPPFGVVTYSSSYTDISISLLKKNKYKLIENWYLSPGIDYKTILNNVDYKTALKTAKGVDNMLILDPKYKYVLKDNILEIYG